ncbi:MAG: hemerythrin family protein [Bryobacterales bacterium]|nr:hemerythrin family protein [Bryobacterales bacterium]
MSRLIRWGTPYKLGHQEIDLQHEQIIQRLNDLHGHWKANATRRQLTGCLAELIDATVGHFRTEERVMVSSRYPRYQSHKADHDAFAGAVLAFQQKFQAGEACFDDAFFDYVSTWLRNHLIASDRPMGRVICRKVPLGVKGRKAATRLRP